MADPLVEALLERYARPADNALGLSGELRRPDLLNALAQPSTADVMAQYRAPQWGGLASYVPPIQPEWMKAAQRYFGQGLAAVPPEAAFLSQFLARTAPAMAGSSFRLQPTLSGVEGGGALSAFIHRGDKQIGSVSYDLLSRRRPADTALVHAIDMADPAAGAPMGLADMRSLIDAFREHHPEVTRFYGRRTSGAKRTNDAADPYQIIDIPSRGTGTNDIN